MNKKQIYIINGSPRKNWNTYKMCKSFANGAIAEGADAEIINLYDINFKGCRACYACKLKNGKNLGKCAYPDELTNVLNKISYGDGIAFATPIYFGEVTGVMKSFLERLIFPFVSYDGSYTPIPPKHLKTAVIYTMNVEREIFESSYVGRHYDGPIGFFEKWISHIYETPERICAYNTYQFNDYSIYAAEGWNEQEKAKYRYEIFPQDLKKAYEAGQHITY